MDNSMEQNNDYYDLMKARSESGEYIKGTRSGAIEDNPELAVESRNPKDFIVSSMSDYGNDRNVESDFDSRLKVSETIHRGMGSIDVVNPLFPSYDDVRDSREAMATLQRERTAGLRSALDDLNNSFPKDEASLRTKLDEMDVRNDLVKELVEDKSLELVNLLEQNKNDFKVETTKQINNKVYEYLSLLLVLKSLKCNLSHKFGQYDPYLPDTRIDDIRHYMFRRRKNGCSIEIPLPKGYDYNDPQPNIDAVLAIREVEKELDGNRVYWESYGYKATATEKEEEIKLVSEFEEARKKQQEVDMNKRNEMINSSKLAVSASEARRR